MKRRYLSVLVIGFLVAAGFSGCEDAAGGITDVPRNTTTITKAGNINLKYNGKHLVVTYDASAGKVRYSAVPGYILTKVTLTMLDGSKEATSVTASYDGTGAAKYEKDGNDENYDITTIGYVKAGAAEQTTIDTIEFSSTENFSKYSGKIDLELVGATEHLKFDPSWVASFIADDGYGNEVLRLNALVDEGYVIDWTAYVYSEEFWNDNKDYDGDDAKKIKNKDKIDAAIESHDVLDALAPSGGGGDDNTGSVDTAYTIINNSDIKKDYLVFNNVEIYGFYNEEFDVKNYQQIVAHIKSLSLIDKRELVRYILLAIEAKSGVIVVDSITDEVKGGVLNTMDVVSSSDYAAFIAAIQAAEAVKNSDKITEDSETRDLVQEDVDDAANTLSAAINAFNAAKQKGTGTPGDPPGENTSWLQRDTLKATILTANEAKVRDANNNIIVIQNGADSNAAAKVEDVPEGTRYVGTSDLTTLETAIGLAENVYKTSDTDLLKGEGDAVIDLSAGQAKIDNANSALVTAIGVFKDAVKTGAQNIYKKNTETYDHDQITEGGGTHVFPKLGEGVTLETFGGGVFGQPSVPKISSGGVSAEPNPLTAENTKIVTSKEISGENGIYTWNVEQDGYYQVTLWGAQGGNVATRSTGDASNYPSGGLYIAYGGRGAKTQGVIWLKKGQNVTFYLGGQGRGSYLKHAAEYIAAGFNGGGKGGIGHEPAYPDGSGGGGATDMRIGGKRIMVAAGGGGGAQAADNPWYPVPGGPGGAAVSDSTGKDDKSGSNGNVKSRKVPGVNPSSDGSKLRANGQGQDGLHKKSLNDGRNEGNSGGGGGYYGGYANQDFQVGSGSGGTSYISGYTGGVYTSYAAKYKAEYYIFNNNYCNVWAGNNITGDDTTGGYGNGKFEVKLLYAYSSESTGDPSEGGSSG